MEFTEVKMEIYVPQKYVIKIRNELNKINVCKIGNYDNVLWT